MKTAFFRKVAAATSTVRTGRYSYEYDSTRRAIHVTDSKGIVDKWVTLADCEPDTTPAPKAKATPATTPATPATTFTLTQEQLSAIVAQAVAQAMAGAIPAPVVESAPAPKATPKAKSASKAKKEVKPLAAHEGKLSKEGKATLKAIQAWAKRTRRPVEISVNGSWIWVAGTEKNDREALKSMGFRWRNSRQMWSWDDTRVKSA